MPNRRPKALTVMRWVLVFAWAAIMLAFGANLGVPAPFGNVFGFAVLAIALVNALWQHMPLASACVVAAVCAGFFGVGFEAFAFFGFGDAASPGDWLGGALGAAAGAAIGYPLIKKVDTFVSPKWE